MAESRFAIAKEKVIDDLETIVAELLRGKSQHKKSGVWNIANPFRPNSKPSQMVVWLQHPRRGAWKDFVSDDRGDAVDLVAFGLEGSVNPESRKRAVAWIFDRYGLYSMSSEDRARIDAEAKTRRKAMEARSERDMEQNRERARKMFYAAEDEIVSTPVETYLASRSIDLKSVPNLGRSLRYRPDAEHWMMEGRPTFPAMIAAMVDGGGRLGACHFTYLQPDGHGKASTPDGVSAKLMWPSTRCCVIRLTDGESGLAPEKAAEQGVQGLVGITEGIEDGLSVAIGNERLRVWAAGSLSGLLSVPDHACASGYLIFKDNDWGKPQAQRLFDRAVARLRRSRKPVEIVSMPDHWGKDVNDALRN